MLAVEENEKKIETRFNRFLKLFEDYENTPFYQSIIWGFWDHVYSDRNGDIFNQVNSFLDIEHPKGDFYQQNLEIIKKRFDLNCNVLEVGGGYLPSFAEKVAKEQLRRKKGTITVYDPKLLMKVPRFPNMKLVKRNFTEKTGIKKYDLLLGILACEGAEVLVEKACEENKNFYISICNCPSRVLKGVPSTISSTSCQNLLIEKAKSILREQGENLEIITLENRSNPILIHKKKNN